MPSTFRSSVQAQAQARSQEPTGAKFVQEVNAVTLAVEKLHPDVGSVIELGGQDAKIIMFREREDEDGETEKTASVHERQVRVRNRRHHRQVHDQGRYAG